jgi:hypothetical protein
VELEASFPNQFRAFKFLTNHPLFSAGNGKDLCHVLATIRAAAAKVSLPENILRFLSKVGKDAGCSDDVAFVALSKTYASDDLPRRSDIETRLWKDLSNTWKGAEEYSCASVMRAALALANECGRASSLPAGTELAARLAGKRFDQARILDILNQGLNETALLEGNPESWSELGTSGLLMKKLDAGGLSVVSCKAEYLGIGWTKKYGSTSGFKRYDHILSLVLNDSASTARPK